MGMYDSVDFSMVCPICSETITGFQTKDRDCLLDTVSPVGLDRFYAQCFGCKSWVEVRAANTGKYVVTVSDKGLDLKVSYEIEIQPTPLEEITLDHKKVQVLLDRIKELELENAELRNIPTLTDYVEKHHGGKI